MGGGVSKRFGQYTMIGDSGPRQVTQNGIFLLKTPNTKSLELSSPKP